MGRPKRDVFAELGIDKWAWRLLLEAVKDDLGTWERVGQELPKLYHEKEVSRTAAKKWLDHPNERCIKAACRYAAKKALKPSQDGWGDGYWREFHPSDDPYMYEAYLKRRVSLVAEETDYPEREFELEEALCIGAAYMRMNKKSRELLRRAALQFLIADCRSGEAPGAGLNDAFNDLAINAKAVRDKFGEWYPEFVLTTQEYYSDDGELLDSCERFVWPWEDRNPDPEDTCRDDWRISTVLEEGGRGAMDYHLLFDETRNHAVVVHRVKTRI